MVKTLFFLVSLQVHWYHTVLNLCICQFMRVKKLKVLSSYCLQPCVSAVFWLHSGAEEMHKKGSPYKYNQSRIWGNTNGENYNAFSIFAHVFLYILYLASFSCITISRTWAARSISHKKITVWFFPGLTILQTFMWKCLQWFHVGCWLNFGNNVSTKTRCCEDDTT